MGTEERIKPLHNFTMPGELRWGNTRHLRCMKITPENDDNEIAAENMEQKDSTRKNKTWNLRTRGSTSNAGAEDLKFDHVTKEKKTVTERLEKSKGDGVGKKEREKFSVSLSRKEIEEDFTILGQRLPRKPKKRPRAVQKQLDTLFPGLWMREITADMYKVDESAP